MNTSRLTHWVALPALILILSQAAFAGVIEQSSRDGALRQIQAFEEFGQTFTAEDARIQSISFWVEDVNQLHAPSDFDLTVHLFQGVGSGGALLASAVNSTLVNGFEGFLAFDFAGVTLSIGGVYTALIDNDTVRWALASNQHAFPNGSPRNAFDYPGGDMIISSMASLISDATFQILPISTPEPGVWLLLVSGLTGLFVKRALVTMGPG